ncbi:hypothetical protein NESM_000081800 [Novymonas esmeraldas]|uniref:Uncharacterized protein n=1 Tax=Novymonas esmeraldas TaxID=1808958 RepID=A0AAW0F154_9TRYP
MSGVVTALESPGVQPVQFALQDVIVEELPQQRQPCFTVDATQPWGCELVSLELIRIAPLQRTQDTAQQQRVPLGAHRAGAIHVLANGKAAGAATADTAVAPSLEVPLYSARAAHQRPSAYKESRRLCIVEERQHRGPPSTVKALARHVDGDGDKSQATRVHFVDVAALSSDPRAALRCVVTGEICPPATLHYRCSVAPPHPAGAATGASAMRDGSQQRRRRVVLLPTTAAGKRYELVCVAVKRGRGATA